LDKFGFAIKNNSRYLLTPPFYDYINKEYVEGSWSDTIPHPMPKWWCEKYLAEGDQLVKIKEYTARVEVR